MNGEPIQRHAFRALMGNVAGQVFIAASGEPGARSGLTATAVCAVSDVPPTILLCVNRAAGTHDIIVRNGVFSINALALGQEEIARAFAGGTSARGEDRFETGRWSRGVTGAPVLAGSLCWLECQLVDCTPSATHTVFFGRVVTGDAAPGTEPLLYHRGDYARLGSALADLALPGRTGGGERLRVESEI